MLRFCARFSLVIHLGIVLGCLTFLAIVFHYTPAAGAEAPGASAVSATAEEKKASAVTWQDTVKMFAAALAISMTAFATAITQRHIGSAGVGALAENPKLFGNILVFLVIPETMVILGFVIAALILF